ncbi:hypothetical protein BT63DRAFT_460444 [Microthyrium microscopicum]|uniref:Secreted protein n=1 Tax=Microthyrium microscopicum TaxID=703497 RepID=A0A6A6TWN2_9PEZI|nr:hypothetical protein BT63DRAFT_460444 [Microthyrium microscopicum]
MFKQLTILLLAPLFMLASADNACTDPRFDLAVTEAIPFQDGNSARHWYVYDNNCGQVDYYSNDWAGFGSGPTSNVCTQSVIFGCSPPPVFINHYHNQLWNTNYECHRAERAYTCFGRPIQSCCRRV